MAARAPSLFDEEEDEADIDGGAPPSLFQASSLFDDDDDDDDDDTGGCAEGSSLLDTQSLYEDAAPTLFDDEAADCAKQHPPLFDDDGGDDAYEERVQPPSLFDDAETDEDAVDVASLRCRCDALEGMLAAERLRSATLEALVLRLGGSLPLEDAAPAVPRARPRAVMKQNGHNRLRSLAAQRRQARQ